MFLPNISNKSDLKRAMIIKNSTCPKAWLTINMHNTEITAMMASRSLFMKVLNKAPAQVIAQQTATKPNTRVFFPNTDIRRWCRWPRSAS